jgi:hypothetical protein
MKLLKPQALGRPYYAKIEKTVKTLAISFLFAGNQVFAQGTWTAVSSFTLIQVVA